MMAMLHWHTAAPMPLGLIAQAVPRLTRDELASLTERLIDRLDEIDGDADAENATDIEDDFAFSPNGELHRRAVGPGCFLADPGGQCDEDDLNTRLLFAFNAGPGCTISDADYEGEVL